MLACQVRYDRLNVSEVATLISSVRRPGRRSAPVVRCAGADGRSRANLKLTTGAD
jgi:hypothetical protein